jgi:uncharacterized protein YlxP (DUF503 family)
MVIGILQFELLIHDAESLKDKRRVLSSLKDRLRRENQVSVAEVGNADDMKRAVVGVAVVSRDGAHAAEVLDHVTEKVRDLRECELGDCTRELLHGRSAADVARASGQKAEEDEAEDLAEELLHLYEESGGVPPGFENGAIENGTGEKGTGDIGTNKNDGAHPRGQGAGQE